jgi:hypothetical protein
MENQLFTLSKIFTERLFRIPDYQRGYAWTEPQLKDFWSDIQQIEPGGNHYTGVLTLETVPNEVYQNWEDDTWIIDSKGYEPLYVVDGQQRLTTSIILIQAILESTEKDNPLNYTSKEDIQQKFIFDSKNKGISRSYIFGYEKDNPSYEYLKTKIFKETSSQFKSEETIYTNNLLSAKEFFEQQIKELTHTQKEELYKKVTQHLLFNIFTISKEVDVCVAFETMNNRGKPLSYLELLKNRLIYLSIKLKETEYEKEKLRRSINDCWKSIYHNLGKNKENPLDDDLFLQCHYYLYFLDTRDDDEPKGEFIPRIRLASPRGRPSRAPYHHLLEDLFVTKRVLSGENEQPQVDLHSIYQYVRSLQSAVESWYTIFNPIGSAHSEEVSIWLDKLNRLDTEPFLPLILSALINVENEDQLIKILKTLERHIFICTLLTRYTSRILSSTNFIKEAVKLNKNQITPEHVAKSISDNTKLILRFENINREIIENFSQSDFYRWKSIRYFLFEYNLHLQKRSKTARPKIFWPEFTERREDFITIEHIYPQNARHKYWTDRFKGFTQKQRDALKNTLGNLLPLSTPKNSSLSNKPFPEKVSMKTDECVGYRYGSYAENEVSKETEWTPEQIRGRGLKMLAFLEQRWELDLGDENIKLKILGLDFL